MFTFNSIRELLGSLHKESDVIDFLFNRRRRTIRFDELLAYVDFNNDRLQNLIDKTIILCSDTNVELNSNILEFLENFTDSIEEVNVGYITDLIQRLDKLIRMYEEEKSPSRKDEYLLKTKRTLRDVGRTILKNINVIRQNTQDAYATERIYNIKKLKLTEYDEKRQHIDNLINEFDRLLKSKPWGDFVKLTQDGELQRIIVYLREDLKIARTNLIDIAQMIVQFLNQLMQQSELIKKIQRIKYLKDQILLKEKTDFEDIINRRQDLLFLNRLSWPTNLSIQFLQSDNAYDIIRKVKSLNQSKNWLRWEIPSSFGEEFLENSETPRYVINFEKLKTSFNSQSENLFDFIMNYRFENDLALGDRVTLFCKLATLYNDDMEFIESYQSYQNLEYAVILPKK